MKVNSYDSLPLVKTVTFYNVIILKFGINIKIITTTIYFLKRLHMSDLKDKFLYI